MGQHTFTETVELNYCDAADDGEWRVTIVYRQGDTLCYNYFYASGGSTDTYKHCWIGVVESAATMYEPGPEWFTIDATGDGSGLSLYSGTAFGARTYSHTVAMIGVARTAPYCYDSSTLSQDADVTGGPVYTWSSPGFSDGSGDFTYNNNVLVESYFTLADATGT
jgi:hypothetical protein